MSDVVNKVPKQGIVSILGGDSQEKPTTAAAAAAASLRRTLSADMSSKRWLAQNEFCFSSSSSSMKKIASSQQITGGSSSCSEKDEDDSLEQEFETKEMEKHPRQLDVWSSILSQKAQEDPSKLPPPYVHPLVKKSASTLSEKSLEVCTESLGSETGSDVFSSYPSSETGDEEKEDEKKQQHQEETEIKDSEDVQVVKNTHLNHKKVAQQARTFPPPLASLASRDGPSVHMHSRRFNGRLVLEAVSVPSQKLFQSQRQNGRLVLTLVQDPSEEQQVDDDDQQHEQAEVDEVFEISYEEQLDDEKMMIRDKEMGILKDLQPASNLTSGIINGQNTRMVMMRKNIMERDSKKNPSSYRSHKLILNKPVKLEVVEEEEPPVSQSLPLVAPGRMAAGLLPKPPSTTTFNSYQYFWRVKPTVASVMDPVLVHQTNRPTKNKTKSYEQKDLVLLRGNKADCLLPSLKCCKEPRRSVLMWEPYCIATS